MSFGKSVGSRLYRGSTWRPSGAGHRLETIPAFPLPDPICVVMREVKRWKPWEPIAARVSDSLCAVSCSMGLLSSDLCLFLSRRADRLPQRVRGSQ